MSWTVVNVTEEKNVKPRGLGVVNERVGKS